MEGLDGRHRDKNGQIERKHGNTKMRTLKPEYPELKNFRNDDTLGQVRREVRRGELGRSPREATD